MPKLCADFRGGLKVRFLRVYHHIDGAAFVEDGAVINSTNVVAVIVPLTLKLVAYDDVAAYDEDNTGDEPDNCPDVLMVANVVEPLTNETLPLASVLITLLKLLISLTLLILVYVVAF